MKFHKDSFVFSTPEVEGFIKDGEKTNSVPLDSSLSTRDENDIERFTFVYDVKKGCLIQIKDGE